LKLGTINLCERIFDTYSRIFGNSAHEWVKRGVAVNAVLCKNLNISGTGRRRTLKVGTCSYLKKISRTCFRIFVNFAHMWAWQLMQFNVKTSIPPARNEVEPWKSAYAITLKKYQERCSGVLEIPPTSGRGGAVQIYFKSQYLMHRSR